MYTIVGKTKAVLFIENYQESMDEFEAAVQAGITIAKWVRDKHKPIIPIKNLRGEP